MKRLINALMTIAQFVLMVMVYLAMLGIIYMLVAGFSGQAAIESKIFRIVSIYTIIVLGIFCIYLHVQSR